VIERRVYAMRDAVLEAVRGRTVDPYALEPIVQAAEQAAELAIEALRSEVSGAIGRAYDEFGRPEYAGDAEHDYYEGRMAERVEEALASVAKDLGLAPEDVRPDRGVGEGDAAKKAEGLDERR
jgi:hypothetical protein